MAGVLAIIAVILLLCRKSLFKNTFVPLFTGIFTGSDAIKKAGELDAASALAKERVEKKEKAILSGIDGLKSFYTPKRILAEGLRLLGSKL